MLFQFRVYAKNVVWPTTYGFVASDFNEADAMLMKQLKEDGMGDYWNLERVVFIEP